MLGLLTASAVAAGVVLAAMAAYVWWRGRSSAGLSLAVLLLSVAWWAAAYAMELSSDDLAVRGRWGDLKYVGVTLLPPAWLVFVAQYTGREQLVTRGRLALLGLEPVAVWTLLALPATHDLVRFYVPETLDDPVPAVGAGPLFWVVLAYANVLVLGATALFLRSMVRLTRVYRVAAWTMVAAALLPWIANLLYNFEVGPFRRIDLTPFAFIVTGAVLVWGLYRERLIDLSSVAWGLVVNSMADGVILCDAFGRVNDANPAAARALGRPRAELLGLHVDELLPAPGRRVREEGRHDRSAAPEGGRDVEVELGVDGQTRHFEIRRQALPGPAGGAAGELVMLRDITARKQSEARLRQLLAERTQIARTLQASLLPPQLPAVPGCELAAVYEPAGDAHGVGGDFYDVFPLDAGRWGIVLGDVSGKGAQAAALTGLIRYTLRTLALGYARPSQVLRRLNDVLLREVDDERYCTVVYAVATVGAAGTDLRLCLAGHHQPLLRRREGHVEPAGVLGTALGLVDEPALVDTTVRLRPGDLLCLFTDGLVETRSGELFFDSQRAACVLAHADSTRPKEAVELLAAAAHEFRQGPLSDDLALLAVAVPPADAEDQAPEAQAPATPGARP